MRYVFTGLIIFFLIPVFGQKLAMTKSFGGVRFAVDTIDVSPRQVLEIMETNPLAHSQFKHAMVNRNVAGVLGFGGAFLIGIPIGSAIIGGKPQWVLSIVGQALIGIAIPIDINQRKQSQKAIDLYNSGGVKAFRIKPKLYFTGTGARLVLRF